MSENDPWLVHYSDQNKIENDQQSVKSPEQPIDRSFHDETEADKFVRSREITSDEDLRMLEEQSIDLARQLMAEEALMSYHQHYQFLRESAHEMSQEDYEALQSALQEDEDAEVASLENDDGNLSYETMLHIGDRIGDVKTERWTMIAHREIEKLQTFIFCPLNSEGKSPEQLDDSEFKCLVCQCEYDDGEKLARLPCGHCFHAECVSRWLTQKDVCPYCRQCIMANP